MLLSYFIGQRKAPLPYDLRSIGRYTLLTLALLGAYYAIRLSSSLNMWILMGIGTVLIGIYLFVLTRKDFPLSQIVNRTINRK